MNYKLHQIRDKCEYFYTWKAIKTRFGDIVCDNIKDAQTIIKIQKDNQNRIEQDKLESEKKKSGERVKKVSYIKIK